MASYMSFYVNGTNLSTLGCIESWDGLLSEAPLKGEVLEFDWLDGGQWQQGPAKTYSFDVPITFHTNVVNPELSDAITALNTIKAWRGPVLAMERRLSSVSAGTPPVTTILRRESASGILVGDLSPKVRAGRFMGVALVFQNISGVWSTI